MSLQKIFVNAFILFIFTYISMYECLYINIFKKEKAIQYLSLSIHLYIFMSICAYSYFYA